MIRLADSERNAFCDLAASLGPDAPTLCTGWTCHDLGAHLWAREARPVAAIGLVTPHLRSIHQQAIDQAKQRFSFDELIQRLRRRRDVALPFRSPLADEKLNTLEFFVHHEDLRRGAQDLGPRVVSPALDAALWARVPTAAAIAARKLRRAKPGVVVRRMVNGFATEEAWVLTTGSDPAVMTAEAGEAILWLFGRGEHAVTQWDGPSASVRTITTLRLGT